MKLLRRAAYVRGGSAGRRCPHCWEGMVEVQPAPDVPLKLDVCTHCHMVWFDPREFEQVPVAPTGAREAEERPAPPAPTYGWSPAEAETPDGTWKYIPGILGMPVEMDSLPPARRPVVTWALAAFMAALFALLYWDGSLAGAIAQWGFVPSQWARHGGLTLLTGFFLHAGLLHIVSNLYFFLVFGDNVEDHLGRWWFIALLFGAHVFGTLLHGLLDPRSGVPCVGASAGIAGVLAYYAIVYPHARLGVFIWFFWRWVGMRAIWAFVIYVLIQLWGSWRQVGGYTNVSYVAHLGGMAVGVLAGLYARWSRPEMGG